MALIRTIRRGYRPEAREVSELVGQLAASGLVDMRSSVEPGPGDLRGEERERYYKHLLFYGQFHDEAYRIPTGTACHYNKGSWLVRILPYIEGDAIYKDIPDIEYYNLQDDLDPKNNSIYMAVQQGKLPRPLSVLRCPSEDWNKPSPPDTSNYAGSMGPQCLANRCGDWPTDSGPFGQYCDPRGTGLGDWGYAKSAIIGSSHWPDRIRGCFNRMGARIRLGDILDGTSNTIMIGETLIRQNEIQQYPWGDGWEAGWASADGGNAHCSTIIPINWDSSRQDGCFNGGVNWNGNWSVAWGFRSRHVQGANFVFADGSITFLRQDIDMRTYQVLGCRNDLQQPGEY